MLRKEAPKVLNARWFDEYYILGQVTYNIQDTVLI